MTLSQTIIGDIFTAEQRAKWQGAFGAIFGLSSVVGPLIGGFLVDQISWHSVFLINVPFGLFAAWVVFVGMKHEMFEKEKNVHIDYFGIVTLVPALILFLLGLNFGGDKFEWASLTSALIFGFAALSLILFIIVELKAKEPILDLSLFKNRVFATTNGLGFLLGLGMFGAIMFIPMFMQAILGVSPTRAGSTMTPMMIALIVASVVGGQMLLHLRYRFVLSMGMFIATVGFFLMSTMGVESTEFIVYVYMVILGFGMGLVMPTLMIAVQNEYPKSQLGTVTSASTFFRSIGGTIGITVLNVVMNHSLENKVSGVLADSAVQADSVLHGTLSTLAQSTDTLFQVLIYPQNLEVSETIKEQIMLYIKTAWTQSFSTVFLTGLVFVAIGVLVALSVGKGKVQRDKKKAKEIKLDTVLD